MLAFQEIGKHVQALKERYAKHTGSAILIIRHRSNTLAFLFLFGRFLEMQLRWLAGRMKSHRKFCLHHHLSIRTGEEPNENQKKISRLAEGSVIMYSMLIGLSN